MSAASDEFVEKLKGSLDLVEIASEYVDLERSGKNYRALCPFHQEDTPSFTINPRRQFFYCFGCGVGGDLISFIMKIENISFREALHILSERAGIEMPQADEKTKARMQLREKIFAVNKLASRFYNYLLLEEDIAERARNYLQNRGFTRDDMEKFKLGFAPPAWGALTKFLQKRDYDKDILLKAGLSASGRSDRLYDRFRNRIIFPIYNARGEVLGFGGRVLEEDDEPKYLNSPETPIFSKKHVLYGLNWSRDTMRHKETAVVVEGYTDVLTAHRLGLENFVASLGTSFTEKQAELLNRYVEKVFIAFDADSAGSSATLRGLEILRKTGLEVNIISLPEDMDPDDYLREKGKSSFEQLKEKAPSLIDYRLDRAIQSYDLKSSEEKLKAVRESLNFLAGIDDTLAREVYSEKLAEKVDLPLGRIRKELTQRRKELEEENKEKGAKRGLNKSSKTDEVESLEWKILAEMLKKIRSKNDIKADLDEGFFSEKAGKVFKKIEKKNIRDVSEFISMLPDEVRENIAFHFIKNTEEEDQEGENKLQDMIEQLKINYARKEMQKIESIPGNPEGEISPNSANDLVVYYHRLLVLGEGREKSETS